MFKVLNVPNEKIKDKMIKSVEERVTSVQNFCDIGFQDLYKAIFEGFTQDKNFDIENLSEEENKRTDELAQKRYSAQEWNFMK